MTDKTDFNGGPAFPVSTANATAGHQDGQTTWQFPGMSLRDYFAAQALVALAHDKDFLPLRDADVCYDIADAMLKARKS